MASNATIDGVVSAAVGPLRSAGGSGAGGGSSAALTDQFNQLTQQLQQLQTVSEAAVQATQDNTQAVSLNSTSHTQSGSSTAGTVGGVLEDVLGVGSGLSPLITGLVSLFGGGGSTQSSPLSTVLLPPQTSVNGGISESAPTQPFAVNNSQGSQSQPVPASTAAASAPQITVQVQALDSQSFMDHSTDIAMAVRQAMLESNVLNDVIQGL